MTKVTVSRKASSDILISYDKIFYTTGSTMRTLKLNWSENWLKVTIEFKTQFVLKLL